MSRLQTIALLVIALLAALPTTAAAEGFRSVGDDLATAEDTLFDFAADLRLRSELLFNFDLDRGITPSGDLFFPLPVADPTSQVLTHNDMRFRTDLTLFAPTGGIALKTRIDVLDNLVLGSTPKGPAVGTSTQLAPVDAFRVKRVWGEVLTPIGLLAAGRMGNDWGLGMLANGGNCADGDSGDAADRIAFLTPLFGHIWAVAYDFSATGKGTMRPNRSRAVDLEPTDDVTTLNFAFLKWDDEAATTRSRRADRMSFNYGAYVSYRWQQNDIRETADSTSLLRPEDVLRRDYGALASDLWVRLLLPKFRMELEAAYLWGSIDQVSLIPGVEMTKGITTNAYGLALETDIGDPDGAWLGGLDLGLASGDDAPGFGANPDKATRRAQLGDMDGAQAYPPDDMTADNFVFHSDYRVDRILFHELIGTVTDAFYLRGHVRWHALELGPTTLTVSLATIASFAMEPNSAPGQEQPLGVELDPTVEITTTDGFGAALEYAVLFPLAGLDNVLLHYEAQPAHLLRARLSFAY